MTLADALASRLVECSRGSARLDRAAHRRSIGECIRPIGSTSIKLNSLSADWTRFSTTVCGAKAPVIYDPKADCPLYLAVTPARVNDITAAQTGVRNRRALQARGWAIELFFHWVKQTLAVKHFYGLSENAVRIQITVALIAFVLIKLAHQAQTAVASLTRFARLVGGAVLHHTSDLTVSAPTQAAARPQYRTGHTTLNAIGEPDSLVSTG